MEFVGPNYLAIGVAVVASMIIGAIWYGVLAKPWMKAAGVGDDELEQKPSLYIVAALCQIIMAWMMSGIIGHLGMVTLGGGLLAAFFCWLGFAATTMTVNHRFQGRGWDLTIIDGGHWLVVMLAQGAIIGALGV